MRDLSEIDQIDRSKLVLVDRIFLQFEERVPLRNISVLLVSVSVPK